MSLGVAPTKKKAVINAEASQLAEVHGLIRARRYRTLSEFVRIAIDEKLERLHAEQLAKDVERFVAEGHASQDDELVRGQALGRRRPRAKR